MRPIRAASLVCASIVLPMGCVSTPRPVVTPVQTSCLVGAATPASVESLSVATTTPINPAHAPAPTNAAERFVFAQLYETLINVDCEGRAYPGLARSWTTDATKTRLTFVLRDGAHFSNGDPLGANDVVDAWRATGATPNDSTQLARRIADATTIVDDHTLIVSLPDTEWLVLATPALAVVRSATGARWPHGSGPYRATEPAADVAPGRLTLVPLAPGTAPRLVIRSGPDARDAIDAGVDVLPAVDQVTANYAAARSDLAAVPLPWLRTYALVVPSRPPAAITQLLSAASDSAAAFRASLARDAVRADARATQPSDWLAASRGCESNQSQSAVAMDTAGQRRLRVVYRRDDQTAREVAQRFVGIAGRAIAWPLTPADFARSLRAGSDLAYVVALPRASLAPCHDLAALLSSAPWLGTSAMTDALVPLLDTRERAIVNRDRVSARIDWDGTLRMSGAAIRR